MKSWHLFLVIAALFNIAQYVMVAIEPIVAVWLFFPLVLFTGLAVYAGWLEGRE